MEITITRTMEYTVEIDDDDDEALSALNTILTDGGVEAVEGADLWGRIQNLNSYDPQDVLTALCESNLADVAGDSYTVDYWDADDLPARWGGPGDDDESDDGEPTTQPLTLPAYVTGEGFVAASLT